MARPFHGPDMNKPSIASILLALAVSPGLQAQQMPAMAVPRIEAPMQVDGKLDEPFWQQAAVMELPYEISPGNNIPASVKTKAYMVDSGTSFRVGIEAFDPEPEKILAYLRNRDSAFQDDFAGFRVDTFDTQQRAYEFFLSARGVQMDLTYDESGKNEDESWNAIWESGATLTGNGYVLEFEIPYSSISFRHSEDAQQWNIQFLRIRPRENRFVYANSPDDPKQICDLCEQVKIKGFAHADPGRNILVNPTLTWNYIQERDAPDADWGGDGNVVEFGMDLSWSPTPNNTLSATYNPDFSQVEIDGAQLGLNQNFALFFPEKRPFYLDSADFFDSPTNLVYTRNIADPDYGLRATGRSGEQTYGVFMSLDAQTNVLRPGPFRSRFAQLPGESQDWVGTYSYSLASSSNIGAILTSRDGDDYSSQLASIDGKWASGAHSLTGQYMYSQTDDAQGYRSDRFTGDAYFAAYEYEDRKKSVVVATRRYDPGFRADMGFVSQVDFERWVVGGSYRWYPEKGFFNRVQVNGDWDTTDQVSVDRHLEDEIELYLSANGKMRSYLQAGGGQRNRYWNGIEYDETFYTLYGEFTPAGTFQFSLFYRGGDQIDFANDALGSIDSFEFGTSGTFGEGLSYNLSYVDETLHRDGGDVYHAQLADLRVSWQFNLRQRLRVAFQYGDTQYDPSLWQDPIPRGLNDLASQLVYSYILNPRTVFYAGYSDNFFGSDSIDTFQTDRNLFLKFAYAWQP